MVTLMGTEIQGLVSRIEAGIGSEDEDEQQAAFDALAELSTAADEAVADVERLRDAIYDASHL